MSRRRSGAGIRVGVALALMAAARTAHADTAIAIVAPAVCPADLRARIAEQIADVAGDVRWSCPARLDPEAPFQSASGDGERLQFWIDLTSASEARLMLRDDPADRFVVRRVPLPRGLDEIGREELGQIVRSALLAVRAGPQDTLTRAEARAEVAAWAQPRPAPAPLAAQEARGGPPVPLMHVDFEEVFGAARALAAPIPVVAEIGLGGEIVRPALIGGWVQASYQLPARDDASPVSVALSAFLFRAGLQASGRLGGPFDGRLGAGAGLTWMSFTPRSEGAGATAARPGTFWYAAGHLFAGIDTRLGQHAVAGLAAFLDVVGADVHYDLRQPDGTNTRVLSLYRFQPGLALRIAWRR